MLINTNTPDTTASLGNSQTASAKNRRPSAAAEAVAAFSESANSVAGNSSLLARLPAAAGNDAPASSDLHDADAAAQSTSAARDSILLQSGAAVLAHSNLNPETVFSLLQT